MVFLLNAAGCVDAPSPDEATAVIEQVILLEPLLEKSTVRYATKNPVPVQRTVFEAGLERKQVIFQHPDSKIIFPPVPVHGNARLEFEIAVNRPAMDLAGDGVEFRVGVLGILRDRVLFSRYLDPRIDPEGSAWRRCRLDLSGFSGSKVSFFLETLNGPAGDGRNDWAGWHGLRLVSQGVRVPPVDTAARPVLLLIMDTLRADRLGCYGASGVSTPSIDRLASEGVLFERAYSHAPMTAPSHAAILTSRYPRSLGVTVNGHRLPDAAPTLADLLAGRGYRTSAVISLSVLGKGFGFSRGFDRYIDLEGREKYWKNGDETADLALIELEKLRNESFLLWAHFSDPHEPYLPRREDHVPGSMELTLNLSPVEEFLFNLDGSSFARFTVRPGLSVLRFISHREPVPLGGGNVTYKVKHLKFLSDPPVTWSRDANWVILEDGPHRNGAWLEHDGSVILENPTDGPLTVLMEGVFKEAFSIEDLNDRYDGEVEFADRQIGRLLDKCRELGFLDRMIVVFTSDHGENLGDHGSIGHVHQLYDSLLRVPLIIRYPGVPAGKRVATQVRQVDILPTILELCGADAPENLEGCSLLPVLSGAETEDRVVFASTYRPEAALDKRAIRIDGWQYVITDSLALEELYRGPPGSESNNLADSLPEVCGSLRSWLDDWTRKTTPESAFSKREISKDEAEGLKALGYLN